MNLKAIAIAAFLCVGTTVAYGHSWYDSACCSNKDCAPLVDGDVVEQSQGWYIQSIGEHVPYNSRKIRISKDKHFHVCKVPHTEYRNGEKTVTYFIRCLYIPGFGV